MRSFLLFTLVVGFATASQAARGQIVSSGTNRYPKEDLEVYQKSLWVSDREVQRTTLFALAHYEEGLDLLEEFIRKETSHWNAVTASDLLKNYRQQKGFETRVA